MGAVSVLGPKGRGASPAAATPLPRGAYYALAVLTALNTINLWHRYLITYLSAVSVEDCDVCDEVAFVPLCFIEEETTSTSEEDCLACRNSYNTEFYNLKDGACIDNLQYASLSGVGFTIAFAVATLFAGRLTDTLNRRLLHTGAILVWSLAAAAHGVCESYECLMTSRVILGIGEAFNAPACYALITLYFPHARRATANGIYSTGTYLGSALSSLCLALAVLVGWRNTALLSGAVGVLTAALLFFTVEHNPVMPPSAPEYTKLPDDDDDDVLAQMALDAYPKLPPLPHSDGAAAAAGRAVISFVDGGGGRGGGGYPTAASYGAADTVVGGGRDRRSVSLQTVLPPPPEAGAKPAGSPSASSTSSSSSYEYYASAAGGGGPAPGGALGSGGSGGDIAAMGEAPPPPRFLIVEESPLKSSRAGGGRRQKRPLPGGGGGGGGGAGGGGGNVGDSFEENPFAVDSAGSGIGRDREQEGRENGSNNAAPPASSSSSAWSDSSGRNDSPARPGGDERRAEEEDGDDGQGKDEGGSPGRSGGKGRGRKRESKRKRKKGGGRGHSPKPLSRGGGSGARGGVPWGDSGGGGDGVAPYSEALRAAGASAGDPNSTGWGWYQAEDPLPPAAGRMMPGGGGKESMGGGGGGGGDGSKKHGLAHTLRTIVSNRVVLVLFAASSARMIATWATAGYMAIYYRREFPSDNSMYSILNACFVSVGGMASSYGGGALADRLRVRNEGVLGFVPSLGSLAAILPVAVVLFSTSFYVSIAALFVTYLVGECWLGPGMACLQMELPKEMAGTSVAILLFLNSVTCNLGTWFIGEMDDGLATVRRPLFAVLFLSYLSSFLLFGLLGAILSRKHQRRNSLASLPGAADGEINIEEYGRGAAGYARRGDGVDDGSGGGGGGRRVPSMCEMVRRTFSIGGGASRTSSFWRSDIEDFRDRGGLSWGRGGYGDELDLERVAFLAHHDLDGAGGGTKEDYGDNTRGAAALRRPAMPRGRSPTRGGGGGGGRRRGVPAEAAAAAGGMGAEVDSGYDFGGGGASVSSTKMR